MKVQLILPVLLCLNGCAVAVHDSIEAIKRSDEVADKSEQMVPSDRVSKLIYRAKKVNVKYIEKVDDLESSIHWKARMFCNTFNESERSTLECMSGKQPDNDAILLQIVESKSRTMGVWNQSSFEALFFDNENQVIFRLDRNRDTMPDFTQMIIGLVATMQAKGEAL
ncbi:hypothetical protein [Pseudoalteromonas luteoviolacea]|uniref:hypothetical protein n=1 Tax=Pseudoalteromonas luteoviolacea TaxID=43657 RepID=UPI001B392141|nr:hypothetical protein [Pseudoalteromonas luteoviolacea]MBQ4839856.1 hypothetical protein [Pseudoalteromonas luteoviolacea]